MQVGVIHPLGSIYQRETWCFCDTPRIHPKTNLHISVYILSLSAEQVFETCGKFDNYRGRSVIIRYDIALWIELNIAGERDSVASHTIRFNIQNLSVPPTKCVFVFL